MPSILLFLEVFLLLDLGCGYISLPTCTHSDYLYYGYTYSLDGETGDRIWSHCEFPNPKYDGEICGMSSSDDYHFVCDPDLLLSKSERLLLDGQLKAIQRNASTICTHTTGEKQSYVVALAIIDKIRVPNLGAPDSCYNDCNEIHPTLDKNSRIPTEQEINVILENFAENLRINWRLGVCDNDIVVLFVKEFNRTHIAVGSRATKILSDGKISSLTTYFQIALQGNEDLFDAIMGILRDVMTTLRGLTPAHIILIIHLFLLAGIGLFYIFFVHLRSKEYDVWGSNKPEALTEHFFSILTGLWFLKTSIHCVLLLSDRLPFWALVICGLFSVCVVIVFTLL